MSNRDVLARLLNNQAIRAESDNDPHRALTLYKRITQVAPEVLDAWHSLARVQLRLSDLAGARESLLAMSEVAPTRKPAIGSWMLLTQLVQSDLSHYRWNR